MQNSGPIDLGRKDSNNEAQQRSHKKRNPKEKGITQSDFYSQYMGFQFETAHQHENQPRPRPKRYSYSSRLKNKKSYMQGNFRFLLSPNYHSEPRFVPPDENIPWEHIELVKYITNQNIHCPICLNELDGIVAPQITRCGHIYCWPCILRHLSYTKGNLSSKCPLCSDLILERELKSAEMKWIPPVDPGNRFKLKLMKRNKNDYAILEGNSFEENDAFSRLKVVNYKQIADIRRAELQKLLQFVQECIENDELTHKPFVEAAVDKVERKIKEAEAKQLEQVSFSHAQLKKEPYNYEQCTGDDFYYFYQETNGLNIFLHPLGHKVLRSECQSNAKLPLELEDNEKARKRYKYLSHIPLNSDIKFVDIDLSAYLSFEALNAFDEEMKATRQKNQPKEEPPAPQRKLSSNKQSPAYNPVNQADIYAKFSAVPIPMKELKLDDAFDYPELPTSKPEDIKSYSKREESLNLALEEKRKVAEKETQKKQKAPAEEYKEPDDYVVKEESGAMCVSDFLFVKKGGQKKNKKNKTTLVPNFH